ncbi:hypothetical protein J6590_027782 [Homalodisca vitripennis]|nr:hypothetical protein J6590_027782 [Homalodisca vitripennis]
MDDEHATGTGRELTDNQVEDRKNVVSVRNNEVDWKLVFSAALLGVLHSRCILLGLLGDAYWEHLTCNLWFQACVKYLIDIHSADSIARKSPNSLKAMSQNIRNLTEELVMISHSVIVLDRIRDVSRDSACKPRLVEWRYRNRVKFK